MYEKNESALKAAEPEAHEKQAVEIVQAILNHPDHVQVAMFDLVRRKLLDARQCRADELKEQVNMLSENIEALYKGSEYIAKG